MHRSRSPAKVGSRSASPREESQKPQRYRRRSHSPQYKARSRGSRSEHRRSKSSRTLGSSTLQTSRNASVTLPYANRILHKRDLNQYRPLFVSYLDIQKQLNVDDLDEREIRGRWKSFVGKWNRGELAEGWYDPETLAKATRAMASIIENDAGHGASGRSRTSRGNTGLNSSRKEQGNQSHSSDESNSEEDYGPPLPLQPLPLLSSKSISGPTVPTVTDLTLRDELDAEERAANQEQLHIEQRAERALQKQRNEELQPRAEPGTRERRLEKRAEVATSNRLFAEGRGKGEGGGLTDVADGELMGDQGGIEEVRRIQQKEEKKKNERELRREEILRARAAEREERLAGLREREEQTMSMLRAIAKERFGGQS